MQSQDTLINGERARIERPGLLIVMLLVSDECQPVHALSRIRMRRSQSAFTDVQSLLEQWHCLFTSSLRIIEPRQIVQAQSRGGVLGSQLLLADCQCSLVQRLRLAIARAILQVVACFIEQVCGLWAADR